MYEFTARVKISAALGDTNFYPRLWNPWNHMDSNRRILFYFVDNFLKNFNQSNIFNKQRDKLSICEET